MKRPHWRPWLRQRLRRLFRRSQHAARPQDTINFVAEAKPGPLVTDLFAGVKTIPGWFTYDDCVHFHLVLNMQSFLGVGGDMLEIGSYHGRSTACMAAYLQPEERLVVCDAFTQPTEDAYHDKPSPEHLQRNLLFVNPQLDEAQVEVRVGLSRDLQLGEAQFRFIHIDGGHSQEEALADLHLCAAHLAPQGVMVMDDYENKYWPGVSAAVDVFLAGNRDFVILADLNRHGAIGRKIYLVRKVSVRGIDLTAGCAGILTSENRL
ncbi:MAG: class I SAM-dependent methyltransferase [Chloroflexi bacterium]|nr:class I SAM-dependent methyltransferase [Chloroflexota bacterium]